MDHPRIRGEHGIDILGRRVAKGSSPHTRGAQGLNEAISGLRRIIPAYAGSTAGAPPAPTTFRDHPRIRGEHEPRPHRRHTETDHPRIRGEHAQMPLALLPWTRSSPHTRGAQRRQPAARRSRTIIPAYAGSTLGNPCNTKDRRRDYTSFPLPVIHPSGGGGS